MAQFVQTLITIDGNPVAQFSSLTLTQSIFEHHHFRLVCPAEAIDGTTGNILNISKTLIGCSFTVQVAAIGSAGNLQFAGVVTQVEAARFSGHTGELIISGSSPTILLDSGPHCKSWEKKPVGHIARDVLRHFPQNLLQPRLSPVNKETLSYTVQYRETAWQFLRRLCSTYGEWLFYDGTQLVLGPPQGRTTPLTYGSNLSQFNLMLQVMPANFQLMAYDYMNHEVYHGAPQGIAAKAGLSDLGKHTLKKSEQFYNTQPKQWHNQFLSGKKQLDDYVSTQASMQSSSLVRFSGSSGQPGVQTGGRVSVQGSNVFSGAVEAFGEYTVISVSHHLDGQGNYSNEFIAVPAGVTMPPVSQGAPPNCETQSALVTDNHDPRGLGRIRVRFHWMSADEKSPWLRVTTPHAGGGKGMYFIPEVGEEVIVGFEGDSAVKPYVIGAVYHGKGKNDYANGGNDVKALQSRSGNKVVLNDKDGSITIADPSGNTVTMHGNGEVTIHAPTKLTLTSPDIVVAAGNSIQMLVGGSEAAPAPTVSFAMTNADQTAAMMAKLTLSLDSKKDMMLTGTETLSADTKTLTLAGTTTTGITAGNLNVDGGSFVKVSSADTDII